MKQRTTSIMSMMFLMMLTAAPQVVRADVELTDEVRDNFGIATVAVNGSKVVQQWPATAAVLDAETLLTTVTDLRAAQVASTASGNELKRSEALQQADNNVSVRVVETARVQAAADRNKVQSLRAQLLSKWGTAIARLSDAQLDDLVQRLLQGQQVLVRVEVSGVSGALNVQAVQLRLLADNTRLNGRLLGAMPQRAEQVVGRAYLLSVEPGKADLQAGQALSAELQDAARSVSGIVVPRAALVRWQGQNWVFVQQAANHYRRKAVQVSQWQEQSVLLSGGVSAGDQVVTVGAGLLLGAEFAPAEAADAAEKE